MKLAEALPRGVTVDGRFYRADFDFRKVLKMLEIMKKNDLIASARVYLALKCVMRHPPRKAEQCAKVLFAVQSLLFPGAGHTSGGQKLTDMEQDADLIRAAFWQAYRVNLWRDSLHWLEFAALLSGLPEGSRYADVVGIRARPMPEATQWNQKEREWLAKAKAACAIRMNDEEAQKNLQAGLMGLVDSLHMMAATGGGGNA